MFHPVVSGAGRRIPFAAAVLLIFFCFAAEAFAQPSWVLVDIERTDFDNSADNPNDYRKATASDGSIVLQIHQVFGANTTDRTLQYSFSGIPGTVASRGSFSLTLSGTASGEGNFSIATSVRGVSRARDGVESGGTTIDLTSYTQSSTQSSKVIPVTFPEASSFAAFYLLRFALGGGVVNYVFERRSGPPTVPTPRITSIIPDEVQQFGPDFLLQVYGVGFSDQAVVWWNGEELDSNVLGPDRVEANVPASLLAGGTCCAIRTPTRQEAGTSARKTLGVSPVAGEDSEELVDIRVNNRDHPNPALGVSNPAILRIRPGSPQHTVTIHSIEAVQVTQSPDNSIGLVTHKPTLVRVFLTGEDPGNIEVKLHGSRDREGQMPLPGSPRTDNAARAFPDIRREGYWRNGEFLLPESWLSAGELFLKAEVTKIRGASVDGHSAQIAVRFQDRGGLTVASMLLPREMPDGRVLHPEPIFDFTSRLLQVFPLAARNLNYLPLRTTMQWDDGFGDDDIQRRLEAVRLFTTQGQAMDRQSRLQIVSIVHPDVILLAKDGNAGYAVPKWLYSTSSGTLSIIQRVPDDGNLEGYVAHEIGHNLGLRHLGLKDEHGVEFTCGSKPVRDRDWPHPTGKIYEVGVEPLNANSEIGYYSPEDAFDLMGYCWTDGQSPMWVDPFTYRKLFAADQLPVARLSQAPDRLTDGEEVEQALDRDYVVIGGEVSRSSGEVRFDPVYRVRSFAPPVETSEVGEYCLAVTSNAVPVHRTCFDLIFAAPETGDPRDTDSFFSYFPVNGSFDEIKLTQSNVTRGTLTRSATEPAIQITAPQVGAQWTGSDQTISWSASDADGDPLRFTVAYSSDGGTTWLPLAINTPDSEITVNAAMLSGGENMALRVSASDGLRFTEAQVGPFGLQQKPAAAEDTTDLDFGPVPVGRAASRTVTFTNTGTGYLEIESASIDDAAFSVAGPVLPAAVRPGDSVAIKIVLRPETVAAYTSALNLRTNDPDREQVQIVLRGGGISESDAFLRVLTREVGFGQVAVNQMSTASVVIENAGASAVQVTAELSGSAFALADQAGSLALEGQERRVIAVRFSPAAEGSYEGRLVLTLNGSNQPPVEVVLRGGGVGAVAGGPQPSIAAGGIVNAASGAAQITPGSWVSIFGTNLAAGVNTWANAIQGDVLPTTLDGVQVLIDGKPAAVYFISGSQINVQAPDTDARGPVRVQVMRDGQASLERTVEMADAAPAWFTHGPGARRYVAAVHPDGTLVGPVGLYGGSPVTRPAVPGDTILLYGTGFGPTNPHVPAGRLFQGVAYLANDVVIRIGPQRAAVTFQGLSGAGLNQINVLVREVRLTPGDQELDGISNGVPAQSGVFLTIGEW